MNEKHLIKMGVPPGEPVRAALTFISRYCLAGNDKQRIPQAVETVLRDPAAHAGRCLRLLGLEVDAAVLAPQQNRRAVFTLSHEQVRRPINTSSIGRWKNYAFAFDGSWDALAAAHERAITG